MTDEDPWDLLFGNRIGEAEAAFRARPEDADSLRGLGWIAHLADDDRAFLETWGRLLKVAPEHWSAAAVLSPVVDASRALMREEQFHAMLLQIDSCSAELQILRQDLLRIGVDDWAPIAGTRLPWKGMGPFQGDDLDRPWAPERGQASDRLEDGRTLRWVRLPPCRDPLECPLDQLGFEGSVFYARTSVFIEGKPGSGSSSTRVEPPSSG